MGELVDLDDQRPHITGPSYCHACAHTWVAVVADTGAAAEPILECPNCHQEAGRLVSYEPPPVQG